MKSQLPSMPPVFQRSKSSPSCRTYATRANEKTQNILHHSLLPNVMDDSALPAPTKFKKERDSNIPGWKFGRSSSAPSLQDSFEMPGQRKGMVGAQESASPAQKLEIGEDIFIKAVILVRTAFHFHSTSQYKLNMPPTCVYSGKRFVSIEISSMQWFWYNLLPESIHRHHSTWWNNAGSPTS
jgi:hypothetical protein